MRSQRRFLSFIGETPAAQLRRMMITDPYVTTFFPSTHTQLTIVLSTTRRRRHDQNGVSTPPAAPATLGDGCARTGSPGRGSAGHPLARIAQLRRGCCPPPAWLTPLACGCCKPPLNRASQQLPLLSCSRRYTQSPSSASSAPHRAVTHCSPGGSKTPSPAAQRMYMSAQNDAQTRQRPVGLRQPSAVGTHAEGVIGRATSCHALLPPTLYGRAAAKGRRN